MTRSSFFLLFYAYFLTALLLLSCLVVVVVEGFIVRPSSIGSTTTTSAVLRMSAKSGDNSSNHQLSKSPPAAIITQSSSSSSNNHISRRSVLLTTATTALVIGGAPNVAQAGYIDPTTASITKKVYLDLQQDGDDSKTDRLVIGVYGDQMPRLTTDFLRRIESKQYVGSNIYRVLSDFNIQGGGDSTGKPVIATTTTSDAAEASTTVEPDNFNLQHTKAGVVSSVGLSGSGFDGRFVIQVKDEGGWADDRYAAFGIVVDDGSSLKVLQKLEKVQVKRPKNTPIKEIKIVGCGVL